MKNGKITLKMVLMLGVLAVLIVSVAGCTSSTSPTATPTVKVTAAPTAMPTATPTVTASPSASAPSASEFNARYAKVNPNYTITTPFTKTINARGHAVYSGMVMMSIQSDKVSVELCTSQSDAQQTFQKIIASAVQQDYTADPRVSNSTFWAGFKPIPNTSEELYKFITGINEPTSPFSADMGIGYNIETIEGTASP